MAWTLAGEPEVDASEVATPSHGLCLDARYHVAYAGSFATNLPGRMDADDDARLETTTDLEAVVRVRCVDSDDDGWRSAWSFEELEAIELHMMGERAIGDVSAAEATLLGHALVVDYTSEGEVVAIAYPDDAPELFVNLARTVVGESQTQRRRGSATWDVVESTIIGSALAQVNVEDGTMTKRRSKYEHLVLGPNGIASEETDQALDHLLEASFSPDGAPKTIAARERLTVRSDEGFSLDTDWTLEMQRLPDSPSVLTRLPDSARWRTYALDEHVMSPETRRSLDTQAAGDLTWDQAEQFIRRFDVDLGIRDEGRTSHRLDAYLALHPEAVWNLARLAEDDTLSEDGRQFIIWSLAQSGVGPAQAALRQVLELGVVRNSERYRLNIQALSVVRDPSAETVQFARDLMEGSEGKERLAAAHGVGSLVARADEMGQSDRADDLNTRLLHELEAADDPESRARMLDALSNTRRADNVPYIVGHSDDPSWRVRAAAARAVVRTPTPEAADMVRTLIADSSVSVQREALRSIHREPGLARSDDDLAASIAESIRGPNVRRALELLEGTPPSDTRDRALIAMAGATYDSRLRREVLAKLAER